MTPEQLTTLKAAILAETDATFVSARADGNTEAMAAFFNAPAAPEFLIGIENVETGKIGKTINYVAYEAMTIANRDKLAGFVQLNPTSFDGTRPDVRAMLSADTGTGIFSGTLGGQGAATRAAMLAIMLRAVSRVERLFATGTGTQASPGTLVFPGPITYHDIINALAA